MRDGRHRKGYTLVETVVTMGLAVMFLTLIFPMVRTGEKMWRRMEQKERVTAAGDAMFTELSTKLAVAKRVCICRGEDFGSENWEFLQQEEGWRCFPDEEILKQVIQGEEKIFVEVTEEDNHYLSLTMRLTSGEETVYERAALVPLLNLELDGDMEIERYGTEDGSQKEKIWYQITEEE